PEEPLHLLLVWGAYEHLLRVRLLPVDPQGRQLRRQRHTGLPEGERGDDPRGWEVREGVLARARSTRTPAAPPEDAERPRDETRDLDIRHDLRPAGGVRQPDQEAATIPDERPSARRSRQLPDLRLRRA